MDIQRRIKIQRKRKEPYKKRKNHKRWVKIERKIKIQRKRKELSKKKLNIANTRLLKQPFTNNQCHRFSIFSSHFGALP
jgi:hypothetical protein